MEQKDFYDILGLDNNVSQQQIKDAYRRLALQYHPDRNKNDPNAASKMKEINEAYAALSDSEKRREYDGLKDAYGSSAYGRFRQSYSEKDIFEGSDIHQIFEEISRSFGLRGFDEIFKEFYGPGHRVHEYGRPYRFGGMFFTSYGKGGGGSPGLSMGGGVGKIIKLGLKRIWGLEFPEKGKDRYDFLNISPTFAQTGGSFRYLYRRKGKELIVKLPPKIRTGQKIRLKGLGDAGKAGGAPGDLYVTVRIKKPWIQKVRDFLAFLQWGHRAK